MWRSLPKRHDDQLHGNLCSACPAGPLSDWSRAEPSDAAVMGSITVRQAFAAGQSIFRVGTTSQALYCIGRGLVGLRMLHPEGVSVLVEIVGPGDLVGSRAFLRNTPHRTTAEALTPVELCWIPRNEALRLVEEHPQLYRRLVKRCLDVLDAAQETMLRAAALSNRDRLLYLLERLLDHCRSSALNDWPSNRLPLSREDIAGMLGVRQETLSRLLGRLRDEGLIDVSGRHIALRQTAPTFRTTV